MLTNQRPGKKLTHQRARRRQEDTRIQCCNKLSKRSVTVTLTKAVVNIVTVAAVNLKYLTD